MYSTPQDVARAALRLLDASDFHPLDHELAAAILAVQVCDWHAIKCLKHPDATREFKKQFATQYPAWKMLLQVANGTKHPTVRRPDISGGEMRGIDFEKDADFWYAPPDRETLFIEIDGKQTSVHALIYTFCQTYLFKNPDHQPTEIVNKQSRS